MKPRKITFLPQKKIIRKYYDSSEQMEKELFVYSQNFPFIPGLKDFGDNWLEIEHKPGINLWEAQNTDFTSIAKIYAELHSNKRKDDLVICHIDTNPRNVIFVPTEKKYYLIDFVDWRWELPEFDIIHFLLFWTAAYDNSCFRSITNDFIDGYRSIRHIDPENWTKCYYKAENYFNERRKLFRKKDLNNSLDLSPNKEYLQTLFNK